MRQNDLPKQKNHKLKGGGKVGVTGKVLQSSFREQKTKKVDELMMIELSGARRTC